ncbi:MAG: alpha-L-glutamate ligase-like protein [Pseudolabrys sp.]|jgi:alpha-L-glutamate ligase-like protein
MMTPWTLAQRLERVGVLGMNARNGDYILPNNARKLYPLVDDKLLTKELAHKAGLATPELYAAFRASAEVRRARAVLDKYRDFVVKPANGSRGNGIIVIKGRIGDALRLASRRLMTWDDLRFHMQNILSGIYSLGGQEDSVLVEYCVEFDPVFGTITHLGVPDIRLIAYKGVPVMGMLRLPTSESDGKANLHQGAIGAGIDLASGRTLTAVSRNSVVRQHPDTLAEVSGVAIPHFDRMLEIAVGCNAMTGLGYVGVDLVLDRTLGPLMLELNARPGLNIQIANRAGLAARLEAVDRADVVRRPAADRIAFAKQAFGAKT